MQHTASGLINLSRNLRPLAVTQKRIKCFTHKPKFHDFKRVSPPYIGLRFTKTHISTHSVSNHDLFFLNSLASVRPFRLSSDKPVPFVPVALTILFSDKQIPSRTEYSPASFQALPLSRDGSFPPAFMYSVFSSLHFAHHVLHFLRSLLHSRRQPSKSYSS